MTLSRHPRSLIDILRRRETEAGQAALLADTPAVVSGGNQGTSTTGGGAAGAQAIEARTADPTGADLYEGRVWEIGGVFKFFTGAVTRIVALISAATQTGDALVAGAGPGFAPTFVPQYVDAEFVLDGAGVALTTGIKIDLPIDFACVVVGWTLVLDVAATMRLDLWSDTFANYPPVVADTMPGADANKPQTAAANKATGGVAGWTKTAIAAGEIVRLNVDVTSAATRATLALKLRRT